MRWLISRLSPPTLYKENGSTPTVKTGRSPFYKGLICFNSLTTKKQMTKFLSANFKKMLSPSYIIFRIQRQRANSVVLVEMAYYDLPHQVKIQGTDIYPVIDDKNTMYNR